MKKNLSTITALCIALIVAAGSVYAARIKANVTSVASNHDEVCAGVTQLAGTDAKNCTVKDDVTGAVILEAGKKLSLKEGQDVILKAKGTGKVMAKVAAVIKAGDDISALEKTENGAIIVKGKKGCIAVIVPEKPFAPENGAKVTIKTKQTQTVEGC